jgi:hypothetical protein
VDDVSVAVYVPLPLSTTAERDPCDAPSDTEPSLAVRLLPNESFSWTVIVAVLLPSATIELGEAVIVDVAGEAPAATVVMSPLVPVRKPSSVAVTVYVVPAVVPVVNVTDALPAASVLDVDDENEPPVPVFVHVTV